MNKLSFALIPFAEFISFPILQKFRDHEQDELKHYRIVVGPILGPFRKDRQLAINPKAAGITDLHIGIERELPAIWIIRRIAGAVLSKYSGRTVPWQGLKPGAFQSFFLTTCYIIPISARNDVVKSPSINLGWLSIFFCRGIEVSIPSIMNMSSALFIRARASFLSAP